jgi:hypothetical protein
MVKNITNNFVNIDNTVLSTQPYLHHAIANGMACRGSYYTASLAAGAKVKFLIDATSCGMPVRIAVKMDAEKDMNLYLYEGAVVSANGTKVDTYSFNRDDTLNESKFAMYHTPTVDDSGNLCAPIIRLKTAGTKQSPDLSSAGNENYTQIDYTKKYLVEIVNASGDASFLYVYFRMMGDDQA